MNLSARKIEVEDVTAIMNLSAQLGYTTSLEMTMQSIAAIQKHPDHDAFVIMADGTVAGWTHVIYVLQLESPSICEIRGLVVDERFRRKGVGRLLVEQAKQWSLQRGSKRLRLRCNTKRAEAHIFYTDLGFEEIKQQKVFEINLVAAQM